MRKAKWIGLTGGIAAGKTLAADWLSKQGLFVIDMDKVGRLVSDAPSAQRVFEEIFGEAIFTHGAINRRIVRELAFKDPDKRKRLETYLHPLIWREFNRLAEAAEAKGHKVVICEAALLIETGSYKNLDELIVILADESLRKERAAKRDKLPSELFDTMLTTQVKDEARKAAATHLVVNDGHSEHLTKQLSEIVKGWKKKNWL